ncbi:MAG: efflux RND transporter periplasmic adaptor subunit [Victivallaceae bacterium]|nr:efflux RND transporter periplasmic adaptor subunit [Victivallaceae bacterium]
MGYRVLTAIGTLLFFLLGAGCEKGKKNVDHAVDSVKVKTVRLVPQTFRQEIQVQGVIQPVDSATVAARVAGVIDFLCVREGDRVKKGDVLFQTDRKNLGNQVLVAKENLKVAQETCKTIREDIKIAETTLAKAKIDYDRACRLRKSHAVSESSFESAEVDWKREQAVLRREQSVLAFNDAKVSQAEINLEIAEKNLADSAILAPFDGVVTERFLLAGEFASCGVKVLEMENQSRLEISARISALYYKQLSRQTLVVLKFNGKELCKANLSYLSPRIDPLSRTFEIKAELPAQKNLVSGTLCDLLIILASRDGYGVPVNAVLDRAHGRNTVFAVKDNRAAEITVKTGFTTAGSIEILNAESLIDSDIVVSGQYFLTDQEPVAVIPPVPTQEVKHDTL